MHRRTQLGARGLTLVETMASIVILGVMAGVSLPMIDGASEAYARATEQRRATEQVAFALDRCVRLLRTVPLGADNASVGITSVSATAVRFADGRGLEVTGGVLMMRDSSGNTARLCADVQTFTLTPLASDGVTNTTATPGLTRRFNITIKTSKAELRGAAFIRVGAMGI